MKETTEKRIVAVAAALFVVLAVALGVHQYFELKAMDYETERLEAGR